MQVNQYLRVLFLLFNCQTPVPGRACMLKDIGFDALGAAVGVAIGSALFIWWDKRLASTQD